MNDLQSALGLIGLLLMILGIIATVVWALAPVRRGYPRLGPLGFGVALLGLVIYLVGGYMGGR